MCEPYDEDAVKQEYARVVAVAKQYGTRVPDKEKTMAEIRQAWSQQTVVQRRTVQVVRGAKPAPPAGAGADYSEPEPEQLELAFTFWRKYLLLTCFNQWRDRLSRKKKLHSAFERAVERLFKAVGHGLMQQWHKNARRQQSVRGIVHHMQQKSVTKSQSSIFQHWIQYKFKTQLLCQKLRCVFTQMAPNAQESMPLYFDTWRIKALNSKRLEKTMKAAELETVIVKAGTTNANLEFRIEELETLLEKQHKEFTDQFKTQSEKYMAARWRALVRGLCRQRIQETIMAFCRKMKKKIEMLTEKIEMQKKIEMLTERMLTERTTKQVCPTTVLWRDLEKEVVQDQIFELESEMTKHMHELNVANERNREYLEEQKVMQNSIDEYEKQLHTQVDNVEVLLQQLQTAAKHLQWPLEL